MRQLKSLALVLGLLLLTGSAFSYDDPNFAVWENKSVKAQTGGLSETQTVVLKWVRFGSNSADVASLASGDVVKYDLNSDDGVTINVDTSIVTRLSADAVAGIMVTTTQTGDQVAFGGPSILLARDDLGKRNWGWMLVHGKTVARYTAGALGGVVAGDPWYMSKDAGRVAGWEIPVTSTGYTAGFNTGEAMKRSTKNGGYFLDSDPGGTNTLVDVFVLLE